MRLSILPAPLLTLALALGCDSAPTLPPSDAGTDLGAALADAAPVDGASDAPVDVPEGSAADVPMGPDDPITHATPNAWTWVPIDGARCIDGSPTGIGVNLAPNSDGLVIFMMGGGACFNEETCRSVFHGNGFEEDDFRIEARVFAGVGPLARADARNPFRTWSYVYVGYCTGDAHAGDNPAGAVVGGVRRTYVGSRNVRLALRRLVPTFRGARRVVVTGVSAGGFGAAFNYDQISQAFGPAVDVSLLDDSGPPLNDDVLAPCLQRAWRTLWNLDASLPRDCAECRSRPDGGGLGQLADFLARKYPTRRLGLISSTGDSAPRYFFSWGHDGDCSRRGNVSVDELRASLLATRQRLAGTSFRSYLIESETHTWLLNWNSPRVDGVTLSDWVGVVGLGGAPLTDIGPGRP